MRDTSDDILKETPHERDQYANANDADANLIIDMSILTRVEPSGIFRAVYKKINKDG
jgi:hypothetical protein